MKTVKDPHQPAKLWDLRYRQQTLVTAQPYPVCVGEKNKRLATGCYLRMYFDIVEHKSAGK